MQIYEFMVTNQKVSNFILHCAFVRLYTLRFRIEHRGIYSCYVRYMHLAGCLPKIHLQEFLIISNSWGKNFIVARGYFLFSFPCGYFGG